MKKEMKPSADSPQGKRAVKQSTMVLILNSISILLLLCIIVSFFATTAINSRITDASSDRFDLTYTPTGL